MRKDEAGLEPGVHLIAGGLTMAVGIVALALTPSAGYDLATAIAVVVAGVIALGGGALLATWGALG